MIENYELMPGYNTEICTNHSFRHVYEMMLYSFISIFLLIHSEALIYMI